MTKSPLLSGFDGLMTLSRREGVDIRPTLLRVLTDLYVQTNSHTADEELQFVELASRLIDQVDDATRAVVRARLAVYPHTPAVIARKLGLLRAEAGPPAGQASDAEAKDLRRPRASDAEAPAPARLSMLPADASRISDMFFAADSRERAAILDDLANAPFRPSPRLPAERAARAIHILEMAAFAADQENFTREIAEALILPARMAAQVVDDAGGEPLACALKTIGMTSEAYQRVLLFLNPEVGSSVAAVYRLSRLYDRLSERAALILLAAWRGAAAPNTRARYQALLHDDERHRARATTQSRIETVRPGIGVTPPRARDGST
jgi:hypothetical protein